MRIKLLALLLLAGSPMLAAHWFVGVGVAGPAYGYGYYAPPPPPPVYYAPPPAPYIGATWIGGYYYPYRAGWAWRSGYWARPPYAGAFWVGPRYYGGRYYGGYWRHR